MVGEKWDNVDRTVLRGSLTERNLARICAQRRAFLLPARSQLQKDTLNVRATEDWPVKCRLDGQRGALSPTCVDLQRLAVIVVFRCVVKGVVTLFRYASTSVLGGR